MPKVTRPLHRRPGTYAENYELYGVSGAYTVAPGLILQSDLMFFDEDLKATRRPTKVATTAMFG